MYISAILTRTRIGHMNDIKKAERKAALAAKKSTNKTKFSSQRTIRARIKCAQFSSSY